MPVSIGNLWHTNNTITGNNIVTPTTTKGVTSSSNNNGNDATIATATAASVTGGLIIANLRNKLSDRYHRQQQYSSNDMINDKGCCLAKMFISNIIAYATLVFPLIFLFLEFYTI